MIERVNPSHPEFGIYAIESFIDGKIYIGGTTKSFDLRFKGHLSKLNLNTHSCQHLQRAFNKYGSDNFVFYPLLILDNKNNVWLEEQRVWDFYKRIGKNLYNIRPNGKKGYEFTDYHRKLSSERLIKYNKSRKGKPNWNTGKRYIKYKECPVCGEIFSYDSKNRKKTSCSRKCGRVIVSKKLTGRKITDEQKLKISKANKGRKPSPKTIQALIKKLKGKKWTEARRKSYEIKNYNKEK